MRRHHAPKLVGLLVGDIVRDSVARTKYGLLFDALAQRFPLVGVSDVSLRGGSRLLNALTVVHPNKKRWKQRFYKNVPAFRARSRRARLYIDSLDDQADLIFQVGVLFDARWQDASIPSVIYTDYTRWLGTQNLAFRREDFTARQLEEWLGHEQRALERAEHIFTRGQFVRNSIVSAYGIPAENVTAVGAGVSFAQLPEVPDRSGSSEPTILFIGKEFYRKGGDLLLQAFARARETIPEARLYLVTGDSIPNGMSTDGVHVVHSLWNRDAIADLYRRCDLFVLPSRLETWGDVLLEAMAFGLPCIGVAGEAMGEIIDHERTGLIVPPGNVEALETALVRLLSDSTLRSQWGLAGRQKVDREYTWDHVIDRMSSAIQTAAGGARVLPQDSNVPVSWQAKHLG